MTSSFDHLTCTLSADQKQFPVKFIWPDWFFFNDFSFERVSQRQSLFHTNFIMTESWKKEGMYYTAIASVSLVQGRRSPRGRGGGKRDVPPKFLTTKFFFINDNKKKLKNYSFKSWDSVLLAQIIFKYNKQHIA